MRAVARVGRPGAPQPESGARALGCVQMRLMDLERAKAGLLAMTRTLAVEWAPHAIRVNAVAPGHVMTPMVEAGMMRPSTVVML